MPSGFTLSVLGANKRQVCVLADLLVESQRLPQCSLFIALVLDLLGALQQLISLSGGTKSNSLYGDINQYELIDIS